MILCWKSWKSRRKDCRSSNEMERRRVDKSVVTRPSLSMMQSSHFISCLVSGRSDLWLKTFNLVLEKHQSCVRKLFVEIVSRSRENAERLSDSNRLQLEPTKWTLRFVYYSSHSIGPRVSLEPSRALVQISKLA